jgi:MATE family multidrug resistance protein
LALGFFVCHESTETTVTTHPAKLSPDGPRVHPRPVVELFVLSAPLVAQMVSYVAMQFTDALMLAYFEDGLIPATAAANAGLFSFSFLGLGWGTMTIVNTLVSQNYGQGDFRSCGRYLWQGVWFAVLFSILILPSILLARPLFEYFGHEARLVEYQSSYFTILISCAFVRLCASAFAQFTLAINRPNLVLIATVVGVVFNVGLNYLLIFGKFGFPRLGVSGAAWATCVAIAVELAILCVFAFGRTIREKFNTLDFRFRVDPFRLLVKLGVPAGFQVVGDVLAWSLFGMWVMNKFGSDAMAAHNFVMRYWQISFMPAFGIAGAVTAITGRYIGMGRHDVAAQRTHLAFIVTAIYMIAVGLLLLWWRRELLSAFTTKTEVIELGATLLIFVAIYQFFDALYIVYNGALRGAGDTIVPAIVTACLCWGTIVFLGLGLANWFPHWGAAGPWTAATLYGMILGIFVAYRFRAGKWKTIRLEPDSPAYAAAK